MSSPFLSPTFYSVFHKYRLGVVHKWRHAILNIFLTLLPHRHAFYYCGLSTIVTKSLTPSLPLRPLHLWSIPDYFVSFLTIFVSLNFVAARAMAKLPWATNWTIISKFSLTNTVKHAVGSVCVCLSLFVSLRVLLYTYLSLCACVCVCVWVFHRLIISLSLFFVVATLSMYASFCVYLFEWVYVSLCLYLWMFVFTPFLCEGVSIFVCYFLFASRVFFPLSILLLLSILTIHITLQVFLHLKICVCFFILSHWVSLCLFLILNLSLYLSMCVVSFMCESLSDYVSVLCLFYLFLSLHSFLGSLSISLLFFPLSLSLHFTAIIILESILPNFFLRKTKIFSIFCC